MGRSHSSGGRSGGGGGRSHSSGGGGGRSHFSSGGSSFSRHHVSRVPGPSHSSIIQVIIIMLEDHIFIPLFMLVGQKALLLP